ncbi:rRNA maturation RNase YbeY [Candidatus Fermentibacterales bacterium]|nr:rRNA maturation RNase YbeY [Candidatus Fermentibacterales bacterium]
MIAPLLEGTVEIVLVDPGHMRVLNRAYRHLDRPTDVLSFDLSDGDGAAVEGVVFVNERACDGLEALLERVFHGYLHLAGMDHQSEEDSEAMQREVSSMVGMAMAHGAAS